MSCVESVCHKFGSISDNNKKDVLLFGDSHFDENKNKFIFEATINLKKKNSERFSGSIFEFKCFITMENVHLHAISKPPKPPIFLSLILLA